MANLLPFCNQIEMGNFFEISLNIFHVKLPAPKKIKTDKDKQNLIMKLI
jgi:hypothetical protein